VADDVYATQREVDQLRAEIVRIDDHGTRGIGVVQTQLTDVIKDVTELKAEMNARFSSHQQQHDRDETARAANRRWAVGLAVAMLGAVGGLYPYLSAITHH
jgi:hypothetical protein